MARREQSFHRREEITFSMLPRSRLVGEGESTSPWAANRGSRIGHHQQHKEPDKGKTGEGPPR